MVMYAAESTEEVERALDFIQSNGITVEILEEIYPALEPRHGNFSADMTFKEKFDENEKTLTQEEREILQTLKERPEIVNILKLFNGLPEEDKPAAFEACTKLLSGEGTAKELISEYWTRKTQALKQKAEAVTQ